jgi:hypothetical protein
MYDDLVAVFDDFHPQLVVHEFAELIAAPIATKRHIPHVTVGFNGEVSDQLLTALLDGIAPLWERQGIAPTPAEFNGQLFLHPFPLTMDTPRADGPTTGMRPLSFDAATTSPPMPWVEQFGTARPGVYVTFGTETGPPPPWAAVLEAVSELDVDVVATIGSHIELEALGPIPTNTRVERYVPNEPSSNAPRSSSHMPVRAAAATLADSFAAMTHPRDLVARIEQLAQ